MLEGKGILTPGQKTILHLLGRVPDIAHFYLTGGTALAEFYLGHRRSFDLDLFTAQETLIRPISLEIERRFLEQGWPVRVTRRFATFVEMVVTVGDEDLRVDLALDTPFHFAPPEPSVYGVPVNDLEDLKAEKTLAYYGRAEMRDAVDLYFLLRQFPPEALMDLAVQKDAGFDRYWFAVALQKAETFPDDLSRWPVAMLQPFDPRDLKTRFMTLARHIMDSITGG
jgi:hypothetical protein